MKRVIVLSVVMVVTLALAGISPAQQSKFLEELGKAVLGQGATLNVESEPQGASVFVNNVMVGRTPLTLENLEPGEKLVRLEKEGFESRERQVTLQAGERLGLSIVLPAVEMEAEEKPPAPPAEEGQSRLFVSTQPPDAMVRILNIRPPYEDGIALDPGSYRIEVSKEGYETVEKWIELPADRDKEISIALTKKGEAAPAVREYDITACHSGNITMFSENEENSTFEIEFQGVANSRRDDGLFGDHQYRCVGIGSVLNGEEEMYGYCEREDPAGDYYVLEFEGTRNEGTVTYLFGTGKWRGIQGEGSYQRTTKGGGVDSGSFNECLREQGTIELPD